MATKTELRDRTLWYDGTVEVDPDNVADLLLSGYDIDKIAVTEVTEEIEQFNAASGKRLTVKSENAPLDLSFLVPVKYFEIDLHAYFMNLQELRKDNDFENERRIVRIENELAGFKEKNYLDMLRAVIYMIDKFREEKVVWGVGRGSSCACYCLYLIGLHLIDPVKFNISYTEFLH